MIPVDLDAARKTARALDEHLIECREHMVHTEEHDEAVAVVVGDAEALAALVLAMAGEIEGLRAEAERLKARQMPDNYCPNPVMRMPEGQGPSSQRKYEDTE